MKLTWMVLPLTFSSVTVAWQDQPPTSSIPPLRLGSVGGEQELQRDSRGKLFNFSGPELPIAKSISTEHRLLTTATMLPLPELPIAESDAILVGEILKSNVFVSNNRKMLYTEFTVHVDADVKSVGTLPSGNEVPVLCLGGVARLPGGGIIRHEVLGYGPKLIVGSKYLLFLRHHPAPADAYSVLKFWKIEGGVVSASFDDDVNRVKTGQSFVDSKALSEVVSMIKAFR